MEGLLSTAALRRLSMLSRTAWRTSAENARTSVSHCPCRLLKRSSAFASATLAAGDLHTVPRVSKACLFSTIHLLPPWIP